MAIKKKIQIINDTAENELFKNLSETFEIINSNCDMSEDKTDAVVFGVHTCENISSEIADFLSKENNLPLIAVIYNNVTDESELFDKGASDVICAPYNTSALIKRIEKAISTKESEQKHIEKTILEDTISKEKELHKIMENVDCGIITYEITEDKFRIIYANSIFCEIMGLDAIENTNVNRDVVDRIIHPDDLPLLIRKSRDAYENSTDYTMNFRVINKFDKITWIKANSKIISISEKSKTYLVTLIDISSSVESYEENIFRIEHDDLTGIFKASAFYIITEKLLKEKKDTRFYIVCFNIEKFKVINEVLGTAQADLLLIEFANLLEEYAHEYGTYGRIQADRFAVCIPAGMFSYEIIRKKIESVMQSHLDGFSFIVDMGVYEVTDVSVPVIKMCDRAALAMQTIHGNYEKHIAYYDDKMRKKLIYEQNIINNMEYALETNQFMVYYQPIYNISANTISYAEALVRWFDPQNGLIFPSIFIPIFEKNGFIAKLDYYVWENVCRFLHKRITHNQKVVPISVNISRRSLYDEKLCDKILNLTEQYEIPKDLLKLEITESAYNDDPVQLISTIERLRENGFHILMDDFGSGYSSLNALKQIPVDVLKIDMKFMEGFEETKKAGNIVTSVVRMAKWLDLGIIAEGVETDVQVNFLKSIGCYLIQGYVFSKPIPQTDFEDLIESSKTLRVVHQETMDINDIDEIISGNSVVTKVFNNTFSGVAFYEFSGDKLEILRVNDAYYELFGYNPETILTTNKNVIINVHPDDVEKLKEACRSAIDTGNTSVISVRRYTYEGKKLLYLNAIINYVSGTRETPIICIFFSDITEEEEAKKSLQFHDNYLSSLYSSLPCGIIQCYYSNNIFTIINANDECSKILGYESKDELIAKLSIDMNRPDNISSRNEIIRMHDIVSETSEPQNCEICFITPDGNAVWLRIDVMKIRWVNNEFVFQSIYRDITGMKTAQMELSTITDRIPGGICSFTITDKMNIIYANDGFYSLFGYSRDEFEFMYFSDITSVIYKADQEHFKNSISRDRTYGNSINVSFRVVRKNGEIKWLRLNAVKYNVLDGNYLYSGMVFEETEEALTYKATLNDAPTNIYVVDTKNYSILYVNDTICKTRHFTKDEIINKKCYEVIARRNSPCKHCTICDASYDDFQTREHLSEVDGRTYILRSKLIDWNGMPAFIEYMTDDTDRLNKRNILQAIMNNTPVGICTIKYHKEDDSFEPLMVSNGLCDIIGYSRIEFCKMLSDRTLYDKIHPEDRDVLRNFRNLTVKNANRDIPNFTLRLIYPDKAEYTYLLVRPSIVEQPDSSFIIYSAMYDTTAEHDAINQLRISDSIQKIALKSTEMHFWEHNLETDSIGITNMDSDDRRATTDFFIHRKKETNGYTIREDDISTYHEMVELAKKGVSGCTREIFVKDPDDILPRCYNLHCNTIFDIDDRPIKAVFTADCQDPIKTLRNNISTIAEQLNIVIWEYSVKDKTIKHYTLKDIDSTKNRTDRNVPECYFEKDLVYEKDIEVMRDAHKRIDAGETNVNFNIRWKKANGKYELVKIIYTSVFNKNNQPVRAVATCQRLEILDDPEVMNCEK